MEHQLNKKIKIVKTNQGGEYQGYDEIGKQMKVFQVFARIWYCCSLDYAQYS